MRRDDKVKLLNDLRDGVITVKDIPTPLKREVPLSELTVYLNSMPTEEIVILEDAFSMGHNVKFETLISKIKAAADSTSFYVSLNKDERLLIECIAGMLKDQKPS